MTQLDWKNIKVRAKERWRQKKIKDLARKQERLSRIEQKIRSENAETLSRIDRARLAISLEQAKLSSNESCNQLLSGFLALN